VSGPPQLVILRALGLGDLLAGVPALRALADAFPEHHRVLLCLPAYRDLVLREGLADAVEPHHGLDPVTERLAAPDVAVDLHGRGPGSQPLLIALRPRRLIAFAHPDIPETAGHPQWAAAEHEVQRWCRLLAESGVPADPARLDIEPPPEAVGGPGSERPTVIHPGAQFEARRWPADRFAAVARYEAEAGHPVVVTGTAAERPLAEAVAAGAGLPRSSVVAGDTTVDQLARLVAGAGRVVSGDTGIAHLATALGTPSVVLFGPISPALWGPPPDRTQHIALWAGHEGDPHGAAVDTGLLLLRVDDVLAALDRLDREGHVGRVPRLAGTTAPLTRR
jgi:ADP-heptose:LPS heptosyltransferase